MLTEQDSTLLKPGTLADLCDAYAQSVKMVDDALVMMSQAKQRMERIIERIEIAPQHFNDWNLDAQNADKMRKEVAAKMQRSTWRAIVQKTGVTDVMIQRKREELFKNIESGNVPPVTLENVQALLDGLRGDVGRIVNDAILEAARVLRPESGEYKTNSAWQLGHRAIIRYGVSWDKWSGFNLCYTRDAAILAIDNAFHLLDGKGVPQHPNRFADAIRKAMQAKEQRCETTYFVAKWFKMGSLHLEFRRDDLVAELNRRAADHVSLRAEARDGDMIRMVG